MEVSLLKTICWDSCICIDLLQSKHGKSKRQLSEEKEIHITCIEEIFNKAKSGSLTIYLSTLVIVESSKLDLSNVNPRLQIKLIRDFFEYEWIQPVAVTIEIAEFAQEIRSMEKLDQYDAIHIATAKQMNTPIFITTDNRNPYPLLPLDNHFKTKDGRKIRIITPYLYLEEIKKEEEKKREAKDQKTGQDRFRFTE
jgi:predicted nucleic acid-binding protein